MPVTAEAWDDDKYRVPPGVGGDGVVRIQVNGSSGTGVLLYDGRALLTVAHLLDGAQALPSVHWETLAGRQVMQTVAVKIHPGYEPATQNFDLALLWLDGFAPLDAPRYAIYRGDDEQSQAFTFVGYGMRGTGDSGALAYTAQNPNRTMAVNQFETDAAVFRESVGDVMRWTPAPGTQWLADFDNGLAGNDALGLLANIKNLGLGGFEGLIALGDSGGPAFIGEAVAGIASYAFSLGLQGVRPDVDKFVNSSFGEIGSWQRVSAFQQWIDESMQAMYPDVPKMREAVRPAVVEGDAGTTGYAYFWLEFSGWRADPSTKLTVEYETREGTAKAWEDFVPTSGKLVIYPGQTHAVLPVEVIGDVIPEPDEFFYLAVFNPDGAPLAGGAIELLAIRTIINDDFF